jgi:hypothetical protein
MQADLQLMPQCQSSNKLILNSCGSVEAATYTLVTLPQRSNGSYAAAAQHWQ